MKGILKLAYKLLVNDRAKFAAVLVGTNRRVPMSANAVETAGLIRRFGTLTAVNNLTLAVPAGRSSACSAAMALARASRSAALFSTLSLIIACLAKTRERFVGSGQVLTMPIFVASNAIYPLTLMPGWLHVVSRASPLSYQVDALRALIAATGCQRVRYGH